MFFSCLLLSEHATLRKARSAKKQLGLFTKEEEAKQSKAKQSKAKQGKLYEEKNCSSLISAGFMFSALLFYSKSCKRRIEDTEVLQKKPAN